MSDRFIDERLGFCQKYDCANDGRVAVVIPFKVHEIRKVERLMKDLIEKTEQDEYAKRLDLFFLANGPSEHFKEKGSELRKAVDETEKVFHSGHLHYVLEFCQDDNAVLKYLFGENPPTFLKDYCFIYFSSVDMKVLKPTWARDIIVQSVDSAEKNFWVKAPLDMSIRTFAYYENIEISLYAIYAAQSPCLKELFLFAADTYPSARVSRAFNSMMRVIKDEEVNLSAFLLWTNWYVCHKENGAVESDFAALHEMLQLKDIVTNKNISELMMPK